MSSGQISQKNPVKQTLKQKESQSSAFKFEPIFKWLAFLSLLLTIPGFFNILKFREHSLRINNYTADLQNIALWMSIGFIFNFVGKKLFKTLFSSFIRRNLAQEYLLKSQQSVNEKVFLQTRQLYDTFFHFGISFATWYYFYKEEWFPSVLGGCGTCPAILSKAFYWPSGLTQQIQGLYAFQIGSNLFHVFELVILIKKYYQKRNYYQLMFHHFVTIGLEFISLFYNLIDVGIVIMMLHDFSDGFRGLNKIIKDSSLDQTYSKLTKTFDYVYIVIWCTLRILVLPVCGWQALLQITWPKAQDMSYLLYEVNYLRGMVFLIISLQTYWFYYLVSHRIIESNYQKKRKQHLLAKKKQEKQQKKQN